jgi:hypothetical protein
MPFLIFHPVIKQMREPPSGTHTPGEGVPFLFSFPDGGEGEEIMGHWYSYSRRGSAVSVQFPSDPGGRPQ